MISRVAIPASVLTLVLFAAPVQALPVFFEINNCALGDCAALERSGGGAIVAELDVINGNDLLITLTNALHADAFGDDPHLTNLGFQYDALLQGLSFDSFTVLAGSVARPTLTVDSTIRSFSIDFGFIFPDNARRQDWFQAANPNEVIQMVIGTTGAIDLDQFLLGVAKIGGAGENGTGGSITLTGTPSAHASIPEPTSLALLGVGIAAFGFRRPRTRRQ